MRLSFSTFLFLAYSALAFAGFNQVEEDNGTRSSSLISKGGRGCHRRTKSALLSYDSAYSAAYNGWNAGSLSLRPSASPDLGKPWNRTSISQAAYTSKDDSSWVEVDDTKSYESSYSHSFVNGVFSPATVATLSATVSSPRVYPPARSTFSTTTSSYDIATTEASSSSLIQDTKSSSSNANSWRTSSTESLSRSSTLATSSPSMSSIGGSNRPSTSSTAFDTSVASSPTSSSASVSSDLSIITSSSTTTLSSTSSAPLPSSSVVSCPTVPCPSGFLCVDGSCVDVCDVSYNGGGTTPGNTVLLPGGVDTPRDCCVLCQTTIDCVASAYPAGSCQLLVKTTPLDGAPISAMCPLGIEDYTFEPGPGTLYVGPCAAAYPA